MDFCVYVKAMKSAFLHLMVQVMLPYDNS
jgi:hypothetical protein